MYSKFQLAKKFFYHYVTASNSKGQGIHSPFVFDFIQNVLNDRRDFYAYPAVESLRRRLLHEATPITVEDYGAGSGSLPSNHTTVAKIAKHSATPRKLGQLLFRVANRYHPQTIVELGTSLGLSTAYLSLGNPNSIIITIEGSPELAAKAEKNFNDLSLTNIRLVQGNFDDQLSSIINHQSTIDLVYVDGNHRKESTLRYMNMFIDHMSASSAMIFDDIHWSKEMEDAWSQIFMDSRILLSIDLFFFGLVFFREDFKIKQHFAIRYTV